MCKAESAAPIQATPPISTMRPKPLSKEPVTTGLWYIGGKAYDFSKFNHPGGPVALNLARNRDCTVLFESYHPFSDKPRQILAKYEVKGAPIPEQCKPVFTFDNPSPFEIELKARVKEYFNGRSYMAPASRWLLLFSLLTFFLYTYYEFWNGTWWSPIVCPVAAWLWAIHNFHDSTHFALSSKWWVNQFMSYLNPYLISPMAWYHQHVVGHHVYTNLHLMDPDLHHGNDFVKYNPWTLISHSWHKWQVNFFWVVWCSSIVLLGTLTEALFTFTGFYHGIVSMAPTSGPRRLLHFLGRALFWTWILCWPFFRFPLGQALLWNWCFWSILGFQFMMFTQINHIAEEQLNSCDSNWYKHQVITSQDFSIGQKLFFYLSGGLNHQIEHHLFPGVCHAHLPQIQPIVKEVCRKHNVPYMEAESFFEAFKSYIAHITHMSELRKQEEAQAETEKQE